MRRTKTLFAALAGTVALVMSLGAQAADKHVTVAYQTDALPSSVAISN
ncbi:taurine ABC transporter substrate-binding protein, partial [Aureimonas leprariae]